MPTNLPGGGAYAERSLGEVAIEGPQDSLVSNHTDALPLTLDLNDDRLQPLDDVQVALPRWVPAW